MSTANVLHGRDWKATTNNNGTAQSSPQVAFHHPQPWWKQYLPHREDLIVAGREVKGGIVIHPIIATAILGVIVTIGLGVRSEMNWQHDQLVKITTQKEDAEKAAAQEHADRAQQASTDAAWRERMRSDMNNLNFAMVQLQKVKEKN